MGYRQPLFLGRSVQVNQQQCQRGDSLLAIDQVIFVVAFADNDRTKKILSIVTNSAGLITLLVVVKEFPLEIRQQLVNVLLLPLVLTLILIDRKGLALQLLLYVTVVGGDCAHIRRNRTND